MKVSPYCHVPEAKDTSAVYCDAGRERLCVRCHSKYEEVGIGRESSRCEAAETVDTRRRVEDLQENAGNLVRTALLQGSGK